VGSYRLEFIRSIRKHVLLRRFCDEVTAEESQKVSEYITKKGGGQMNVNIKRLHDDARIPTYATDGSAGFDLYAVEDVIIAPGETAKIPLGLAFEIPQGFVMYVMMRSGIALRTKLRQSNGIGVIDSDYRGEVAMMFDNICGVDGFQDYTYGLINGNYFVEFDGTKTEVDGYYYDPSPDVYYLIRKNDRICQAVIQRVEQAEFNIVDELTETARGGGGFGHSGVNTEVNNEGDVRGGD
jgi:dUTP pyrophosphatase